MFPILRKELWGYFGSLSTYIIIAAFIIITTLFLWFFDNDFNILNVGLASLNTFFLITPWIFVFLIPALTMKSIAEEDQNGTLAWLFTKPISITQIVVEKFIAILILVIFILCLTLVYFYTVYKLSLPEGNLDMGTIVSGYIGVFLLSASFAAMGIFASSLAKNQVLAFVIGVFLSFFAFYALENLASYNLLGRLDYFISKLGVYNHYNSFTKGIVGVSDICYFILVSSLFLLLSVWVIKTKK